VDEVHVSRIFGQRKRLPRTPRVLRQGQCQMFGVAARLPTPGQAAVVGHQVLLPGIMTARSVFDFLSVVPGQHGSGQLSSGRPKAGGFADFLVPSQIDNRMQAHNTPPGPMIPSVRLWRAR